MNILQSVLRLLLPKSIYYNLYYNFYYSIYSLLRLALGVAVLMLFALGVAVLIQNYRHYTRPVPVPTMSLNAYWGPGNGNAYKENIAVKAFDIAPKPELIVDLKAQLGRSQKLHEPLEGVGFEYGFNTKYLQKVVTYWRDIYLTKWSEREIFLKKFPHYTTEIQGLNIHFLHAKPKKTDGKKVLPLLLLHGWPGSVREFYDIIPMLTTPNPKSDYVFEVVAPSLPGYGWSQGSYKTGFGHPQIAVIMRNLMLRLGHPEFVVQGGDWGAIIGSSVATLFPRNVIGYHSNMCGVLTPLAMAKHFISMIWPSFFYEKHQIAFHFPEQNLLMQMLEEAGYAHIQATKPDTIGTALAHNPIGLAAYILEKFSTWTNPGFRQLADGGLTKRYTLDALLDNVMIYYVTNSITTSQRLYAESFGKEVMALEMDRVQTSVPTGCARFKHDLSHSSDWQLREKFLNLVHSTYYVDGGHFAAMEVPETLYNDFLKFIKKTLSVDSAKKEDL